MKIKAKIERANDKKWQKLPPKMFNKVENNYIGSIRAKPKRANDKTGEGKRAIKAKIESEWQKLSNGNNDKKLIFSVRSNSQ